MTVRWTVRAANDQGAQFAPRVTIPFAIWRSDAPNNAIFFECIRTNKRGTALVVVPFLFWRLTRMQNPLREDVIVLSVT